jgi:hypothetical protein
MLLLTSLDIACAPVKNTTKRTWVRVMGSRFDMQYWQPDERIPNPPSEFTRKYGPTTLGPNEAWIAQILEPVRQKHKLLASGEIFLPSSPYNATDSFARLMGYELEKDFVQQEKGETAKKQKSDYCFECNTKFSLTNGRHHCVRCGHSVCSNCSTQGKIPGYAGGEEVRLCEKCRIAVTPRKSLRELVILRKHRAVHYYKIVEHGRQFFKSLLFSSDWRYTLYGKYKYFEYLI